MSEAAPLDLRVDREDRLLAADPLLAAINERAGGATGRALAVPQLAAIARLARRLDIGIGRATTIADGEADLDCWIAATPDRGEVTLSVSLLRERPAWRAPVATAVPARVPPPPGADWTWETDADLRIVRIDTAGALLAGVTPADALGQPVSRLFALATSPQGGLPLVDAMAEAADFDAQPASIPATGAPVMLAGHARLDAAGRFAGFAGGTFAAPRASAEAAPAAATPTFNARLERILRGPLGRIVAHADSIHAGADGPLEPHYADYAADISSAGRHLLGLVDDLVDLEAIERADFRIEREAVDLADVARRAAGLLAVRAADAGVTIDRSGLDQPLPASGEFRRCLQILVNLVGNAVRYSPRGGTVWLTLQREEARAVLIVADQGKGIAVADQARIFEKFERVDVTEPGGSGLGLYIARRLARAMDGDLAVDSAPGMGARFVLSLPLA